MSRFENFAGVSYSPTPKERNAELAFVFPGSGNHYLGMGRGMSLQWPEILRQMDNQTLQLKNQLLPQCYVPWRISWEPGWQKQAYGKIIADPMNMIFGSVVHAGVVAKLMAYFAIRPKLPLLVIVWANRPAILPWTSGRNVERCSAECKRPICSLGSLSVLV
jgi:hypothetical protein